MEAAVSIDEGRARICEKFKQDPNLFERFDEFAQIAVQRIEGGAGDGALLEGNKVQLKRKS